MTFLSSYRTPRALRPSRAALVLLALAIAGCTSTTKTQDSASPGSDATGTAAATVAPTVAATAVATDQPTAKPSAPMTPSTQPPTLAPDSPSATAAPTATTAPTAVPTVINGTPVPRGNANAVAAFTLWDSIGINTHFGEGIERGNYAGIEKLLANLGVRHVREGVNSNYDAAAIALSAKLHNLYGIRFTETVSHEQNASEWARYQAALGPAFEGWEGPNEVDYGSGWAAPLLDTMTRLSAFAKRTPGTVVEGPSLIHCDTNQYGDHSDLVTYLNMHWYFSGRPPTTTGWGGSTCGGSPRNGYGSYLYNLGVVRGSVADKNFPLRVTETGYCSAAVSGCSPEDVNAAYTPQIFLFAIAHGIDRTYLYQLLSEDMNGLSHSFGLVSPNFVPRPSYYAMQGLIARLKDTPSAARNVAYSISGGDAHVHTFPLSYANGDVGLLVYSDAPIWNPNGTATKQGSRVTIAPQNVTLNVPAMSNLTISTFGKDGIWKDDTSRSAAKFLPLVITPYVQLVRYSPR